MSIYTGRHLCSRPYILYVNQAFTPPASTGQPCRCLRAIIRHKYTYFFNTNKIFSLFFLIIFLPQKIKNLSGRRDNMLSYLCCRIL